MTMRHGRRRKRRTCPKRVNYLVRDEQIDFFIFFTNKLLVKIENVPQCPLNGQIRPPEGQ